MEVTPENRPRRLVLDPVAGFTRQALLEWARRRLLPGAHVYSDGTSAFGVALAALGHGHTVLPGKRRAATEQPHSRWLNVILGNVKRSLDGAYHAFGFFKYAQRYLAEAAWRFNRRFQLEALVPKLLETAACCRGCSERELRQVLVYSADTRR